MVIVSIIIQKLRLILILIFFFNDTATTDIYTLSLHDALPISTNTTSGFLGCTRIFAIASEFPNRSEEHTSELQSRPHLVCRLLLEKKKKKNYMDSFFSSPILNLM